MQLNCLFSYAKLFGTELSFKDMLPILSPLP